MQGHRGQRALAAIAIIVVGTLVLAACDRSESTSTPTTFRIYPVTTLPDGTQGTTATTLPPTTTTVLPTPTAPTSTTTTRPTTTTTFRVVSPAPPPATTTTTAPTTTTTTTTTTEPAGTAGQGWITVLASLSTANYTRADAAAWRLELGIDSAELLLSDDYSSLTPGYWVLYRGPYPDRATAAGVCAQYRDRVPGCYPSALTLAG